MRRQPPKGEPRLVIAARGGHPERVPYHRRNVGFRLLRRGGRAYRRPLPAKQTCGRPDWDDRVRPGGDISYTPTDPCSKPVSALSRPHLSRYRASFRAWGASMRRRNFLGVLGGAMAIWPLAARAQQPTIPVIGFLSALSPEASVDSIEAFRRGLAEAGFVEGQNIAIEYRWLEGQYDRLQAFTGEFVRRPVSLISCCQSACRTGRDSRNHVNPDRIRRGPRPRSGWASREL
jgi:hypothetical protein